MANPFPDLPTPFVGREDYVARFKARLEHFRFFLYEGIPGIGKTALLIRLARETEAAGLTGAIYIAVQPGEGIASLTARLDERLGGHGAAAAAQSSGDPYARLVDLLTQHKRVLMLDTLHNLRKDDIAALVRSCYRLKSPFYRILASIRGEPDLNAMDRAGIHYEAIRGLNKQEARALGEAYKLPVEALERLQSDANRNGALSQPLTARYVAALGGAELVPDEVLKGQSARSVHAFKNLYAHLEKKWNAQELACLCGLARLGTSLQRSVAEATFGNPVKALVEKGLVDVIDGDISVHDLVVHAIGQGPSLTPLQATTVAEHLKGRAHSHGEPLAAVRAAEILLQSGATAGAIDMLAGAAEWTRDAGFLEAYLQALSRMQVEPQFAPRLKLLGAQARMRHGHASVVLGDMVTASQSEDTWTRQRAFAALAQLYTELRQPEKVIAAYDSLLELKPPPDVSLRAGLLACEALVQDEKLADAEPRINNLLTMVADAPSVEGQLRRLLGHIFTDTGRMPEAISEAERTAAAFERAGDMYHMAAAYGFIGDLHREAGEFAEARLAFAKFSEAAQRSGDRSLIQIAELADAWVSLDIGDVAHAAKKIAAVEKEVGPAPSRRLKRYLAAAQGLLEAGRGHHDAAAEILARVVETWEAAGQRTIAGTIKAQLIRSLIACDKLDAAETRVQQALSELDPKANGSRVASLLRESALIRLRRGDVPKAMEELGRARQLFAENGIRREEALTLHRIGYAALDEGNVALAAEKAAEALELATRIKHARARALSRELMSRIALLSLDPDGALTHAREAQQSLRKLGDELGVLHVSETLMRIYMYNGDLANALKIGPKLRDQAGQAGMRDLRVRAVALSGVALLRREKPALAEKCYRPLPKTGFTPMTRYLMARFGESLALALKQPKVAHKRRAMWVRALKQMRPGRRALAIQTVDMLALSPRDRAVLRTHDSETPVNTEQAAIIDTAPFDLFVDIVYRRVLTKGKPVKVPLPWKKLVLQLAFQQGEAIGRPEVIKTLGLKPQSEAAKNVPKTMLKLFKPYPHIKLKTSGDGLSLVLPSTWAMVVPIWLVGKLSESQKALLRLLRRTGSAPMHVVQEVCNLSRAAARRDVGLLTKANLIEAVREGRGQVYRLK